MSRLPEAEGALLVVDLPARFVTKVDFNGPAFDDRGPCWLWMASLQSQGYGQFWLGGTMVLTHRLAYERVVGPVPDGLELDHLCRRRQCCNPAHLEAVTRQVNFRRGDRAGALGRLSAAKTHCPKGHPYSPENTWTGTQRRKGRPPGVRRECRTCWKERRAS